MQIKNFFLELFFPEFCLNCGKLGPPLCANCYNDLKFYFIANQKDEMKKNLNKIYFDNLQIMANFSGCLAKLIKAIKYENGRNIAYFLAKMLYRHQIIPQVDMITFIPLHPYKLRSRGYNQGQIIAFELGRITNLPVKNLLFKKENTLAQATIKNQEERLARMQNLFTVQEKYKQLIQNKKILLLDDIVTTGATINSASQVLKVAQVKQIFAIALGSKME